MTNIILFIFSVIVYLVIVHLVAVYQYKIGKYKEHRETGYEDGLVALDSWVWPVYFISNIFWFISWLLIAFIRLSKYVAENLND